MALKLYYHPLSSFCHKVLIALYENDAPFEPVLVDLGEEKSRAAFLKIWPMGQFPVLVDEGRNHMVPESSIIIEYLNQHYPGKTKLLPEDGERARQTRMRDRFFDFHVHIHMQKIMGDRRRPDGGHDPIGVQDAKDRVLRAYALIEEDLAQKTWAMGDDFTMADCAAAPALFYGSMGVPFGEHKNAAAYLERLKQRPSYTRVLKEAEPYFSMLPKEN
ncbi:MAG: glutathione S-transferase family protein [Alphaproteobacteria bacterium]|nr:glutathione S-transferase family protein [Alphaproteobacteria bacterium]